MEANYGHPRGGEENMLELTQTEMELRISGVSLWDHSNKQAFRQMVARISVLAVRESKIR